MVPKLLTFCRFLRRSFRAVLFRMVPKPPLASVGMDHGFRAVLFRMVPKPVNVEVLSGICFRAVLFRMVPKPSSSDSGLPSKF